MKTIIAILTSLMLLTSCQKDDFDFNNPDVSKFVSQLKNGTYNTYHVNENGEKLWTEMPAFTMKHVPQLIEHAKDTSLIPDLSCVPVNPISSRLMWPHNRPGKVILGEYLLWCAQYAISGRFPSLDPFLVNSNEEKIGNGITAKEVLHVQKLYENWWLLYGEKDNPDEIQPLYGTPYHWF